MQGERTCLVSGLFLVQSRYLGLCVACRHAAHKVRGGQGISTLSPLFLFGSNAGRCSPAALE